MKNKKQIKVKGVPCRKCGGEPKIHNEKYPCWDGLWFCACQRCGCKSSSWAYQNEAWIQWGVDNKELNEQLGLDFNSGDSGRNTPPGHEG